MYCPNNNPKVKKYLFDSCTRLLFIMYVCMDVYYDPYCKKYIFFVTKVPTLRIDVRILTSTIHLPVITAYLAETGIFVFEHFYTFEAFKICPRLFFSSVVSTLNKCPFNKCHGPMSCLIMGLPFWLSWIPPQSMFIASIQIKFLGVSALVLMLEKGIISCVFARVMVNYCS